MYIWQPYKINSSMIKFVINDNEGMNEPVMVVHFEESVCQQLNPKTLEELILYLIL